MKTDFKLRKISSTLRCGSILLAVLLPLAVFYSWFVGPVAAAPIPHPVVQTSGSGPLLSLLFGGLIWSFARILEKATEIAEENAQIV